MSQNENPQPAGPAGSADGIAGVAPQSDSAQSPSSTKVQQNASLKSVSEGQNLVNQQPQPIASPRVSGGNPTDMGRQMLADLGNPAEPLPVWNNQGPDEYPKPTLLQNLLALPLRAPVCMCDCLCYTCAICGAAQCTFISDDETSLSRMIHDPERNPGACTGCIAASFNTGCCPAFNRQDYPAARREPKTSLKCAGIFCWPLFPLCQLLPCVICAPCGLAMAAKQHCCR